MFTYNYDVLIRDSFSRSNKQVIWRPIVYYENIEDYEAKMSGLEEWIFGIFEDPDFVQRFIDDDSSVRFGIINRLLSIIKKPQRKLDNSTREEEWARTMSSGFTNELLTFCHFLVDNNLEEDGYMQTYLIGSKFNRDRYDYPHGDGLESISLFYNCQDCGNKTEKIWGSDYYMCENCAEA